MVVHCNFLTFHRHINTPITVSQPRSIVMGFQNHCNQTCGTEKCHVLFSDQLSDGGYPLHVFHLKGALTLKKNTKKKVKKTAIESTAFIM